MLHKVDAEKDDPELAKLHQIGSYPTFVMVNDSGQTLDRWVGYTKDMFIDLLSFSLTDLTTIEEKQTRFAATPTAQDAATLARYHQSRGEFAETVELYRRAQELDPQVDHAMEIFDAVYYDSRRDGEFTLDDTRAAADAVLESAQSTPENLLDVAGMMAYAVLDAGQPELLLSYLNAAFERSAGIEDEGIQTRRKRLAPHHALYIELDEAKAIALKRESMDAGWMEDTSGLNGFAWWCFQNRVNLPEALTLAQRGVELAEPGKAKAMILDTTAEICNQLDDCRQAVDLMQLAIAEDPENEHYQKQLERFQARLAQLPLGS